jgi:hypothetical protein
MNKQEIIDHIMSMGTARLSNRQRVASLFLEHPELVGKLMQILFESKKDLTIRTAYTLEIVCIEDLNCLAPYMDIYVSNLLTIKSGSAIRALSKIASLIAQAYTMNKSSPISMVVKKEHIDQLVEVGFLWLISDHKVAIKVHSMELLYQLGRNSEWIHDELRLIIQKNMSYESCGYQARGKKVLDRINRDNINT